MDLNVIPHPGPGTAPPLLIAHGLFGSARNWGVIARALASHRAVRVVDMRNHGDSPWSDDHSYAALAEDLAGLIPAPQDVLGHSMGGKAAMMLALTHPQRVHRLVVADIAPVAYDHTHRAQFDAMRRVDVARVASRAEAATQLQAATPELGAFLLQSLDIAGRRWRLNLAALEDQMPQILGWPQQAGRFDGPALFLTGAQSDYVRPEHHATIRALFGQARFVSLPGTGHWLHAERPKEFVAAVEEFLSA